jgi:hypothetical protein
MNTETILMIEIFQEADPLGSMRVSPEEYLDSCDFEIDRIGRVFKYLGLAQGGQSDLCWQPTPMLMKIIAERLARISVKVDPKADDGWNFIHALITHATGLELEDHHNAINCCRHALAALGLLQEVAPGARAYRPTRRLRDLMLRRLLQQPARAART